MSVFLQPIQTVTVGSGFPAIINFSNIPSTYTDLLILYSAKTTATASNWDSMYLIFNTDSSQTYNSATAMFGNGSSASSNRDTNTMGGFASSNASGGTNTFGSNSIYIANYAGSNYKSIITEAAPEINSSTALPSLISGLCRQTAAITTLQIGSTSGSGLFSGSIFSLYGILRQGI